MTAIKTSNAGAAATNQIVVLPDIHSLKSIASLTIDELVATVAKEATTKDVKDDNAAGTSKRRHPFVDALNVEASHTKTANGAAAFHSTASATLDAFNQLNQHTSPLELDGLLRAAWKENTRLALRVIWNTRSIPDGKGDKPVFYRCWGWLFRNHPQTALANLAKLVEPLCEFPPRRKRAEQGGDKEVASEVSEGKKKADKGKERTPVVKSHGYWKDLLNILTLAVLGQLEDQQPAFLHGQRMPWTLRNGDERPKRERLTGALKTYVEDFNRLAKRARAAGLSREALQAKERFETLERSLAAPTIRALYALVARLFADRLLADIALMDAARRLPAGEGARRDDLLRQISLAGKWAPTPGASHDRLTNVATAVASLVCDGMANADLPAVIRKSSSSRGSGGAAEAHVLRSYYQRWILRELRATLEIPEPLMAAGQWGDIPYRRVASLAMARSSHLFFQHDTERFKEYVSRVETGTSTMSGATMLPHELLRKLVRPKAVVGPKATTATATTTATRRSTSRREAALGPALEAVQAELREMETRVVEAQWKTLIGSLRAAGSLGDTMAICDVSGSMGSPYFDYLPGTVCPIWPAVSLSLVIASLAREPFNGGFITFSKEPAFVQLELEADPLLTSFEKTMAAPWGMNTDFRAVFLDLLLPMAVRNQLAKEDMVKRLFVFSDMQFDAALPRSEDWETTYDAIEREFRRAGYEVPQIVFWNLSTHHQTAEVQADRRGVAMMSGFSPAMVKVFMGEDEDDDDKEGEENDEWEQVGKKEDEARKKEKDEEEFTPQKVMEKALLKSSFDTLRIVD